MSLRRPVIRHPKQTRARESMARMLDAAEALFAEGGEEAITVEAITKRAKTSISNFYARFEDRAGLLRSMHARFLERAATMIEAAVTATAAQRCLSDAIEAFVGVVFNAVQTHRNSARFFILHKAADSDLREMGLKANVTLANAFAAILTARKSEIRVARSAVAIDTACRLLFAMLIQQVMFDPDEVTGHRSSTLATMRETSRVILYSLGGDDSRGE